MISTHCSENESLAKVAADVPIPVLHACYLERLSLAYTAKFKEWTAPSLWVWQISPKKYLQK